MLAAPETAASRGLSTRHAGTGHGNCNKIVTFRPQDPAALGERPLLRYTWTAWKAWGRWLQLRKHEQTWGLFGWSSAEAFGDAVDRSGIPTRPDEENSSTTRRDKGQAPLGSHRRRRQRFRDRNAEEICLLLLRPALNYAHVRELARGLAQEHALTSIRLEQRHLTFRQGSREWNARCASARTDIDDRSLEPPHDRHRRKALLNVDACRLIPVANRCEAWCS